MGKLVEEQASRDKNFLLLISCNLDNEDQGEIRRVFQDINRELGKMGIDANRTIQAYLKHNLDEARLKVYVPYLTLRLSDKWYQLDRQKPIYYQGNKATHMMHFAFWLKRTARYVAGKPTPFTLINIINQSTFQCVGGNLQETNFGIPQIEISTSTIKTKE